MKARDAVDRARAMIVDAQAKLTKATAGIEKAKEAQAESLAQAAGKAGGALSSVNGIRAARAAQTDAQDQLDATREALASCEENLVSRERDLRWARPALDKAVDTVIAHEAGSRILKEAQELQDALVGKRLELRAMLHTGQMPEDQAAEANRLLYTQTFPGASGCIHYAEWDQHPSALMWQKARADLAKDADAEIPGVSR